MFIVYVLYILSCVYIVCFIFLFFFSIYIYSIAHNRRTKILMKSTMNILRKLHNTIQHCLFLIIITQHCLLRYYYSYIHLTRKCLVLKLTTKFIYTLLRSSITHACTNISLNIVNYSIRIVI